MYDKAAVSSGAATLAALPVTGLSVLWFVIAGFALLMAGGALWRIVPRAHA